MRCRVLVLAIFLAASSAFGARLPSPANDYRQLKEATPLPTQLDPAFEFRKTKLFLLGDLPGARVHANYFRGGTSDPGVNFEASYRLWGAVTELDRRARFGHYFDFWWRAKRDAFITVRLEYRQEKLRAFTQAREVDYPHARGHHKTSFAVIGDDFSNDGHVLSWRCLLIEKGHIVAEKRSYLWR